MNEVIFFIHVALLIGLSLFCLKLGQTAISALIVLMGLASNVFVLKQISLFGLTVTAADAYAICGIFSLNLLQEYYGKESASKLVFINFFCLAAFCLFSVVHLQYTPSPYDLTHGAYREIFQVTPRIMMGSLVSFFISQKIDVYTFSILRKKIFNNSLGKSALVSSLFSQTIDTILFSFLALYGQVESVFAIIFFSLIIKVLTMMLMTPMMNFSKKIMSYS
jgi:uncharacterized integral membrane protein (TIGR00697 family)